MTFGSLFCQIFFDANGKITEWQWYNKFTKVIVVYFGKIDYMHRKSG